MIVVNQQRLWLADRSRPAAWVAQHRDLADRRIGYFATVADGRQFILSNAECRWRWAAPPQDCSHCPRQYASDQEMRLATGDGQRYKHRTHAAPHQSAGGKGGTRLDRLPYHEDSTTTTARL